MLLPDEVWGGLDRTLKGLKPSWNRFEIQLRDERLDRTLKGLKHFLEVFDRILLGRLDRTLKGLKLFRSTKRDFAILCLDRTLKGLKQYPAAKSLERSSQFGSYLEGIETRAENAAGR